MQKTIGILTGGGDVPGLNPAIKAVVTSALEEGYRVIGINRGWAGLLNYNLNEPATRDYFIRNLINQDVRTVDRTGGTFLHTSRTNPERIPVKRVPEFLTNSKWGKPAADEGFMDYTDYVVNGIEKLGIDVVVPIGGDDTLSFAVRLHKEGVPILAIPKTMDNDVYGTDYCIGFSTAVTRSVEFITNIRTTAGSHERIAIVELFGRNSGETSLISAYLAFVDRAVISEVPANIDRLTGFMMEDKRNNPSHYSIMTISEGAVFEGGDIVERGEEDMFGHRKLGGIGQILAEEMKRRTGEDVLYQQLAYLMRSGAPDSLDRMVATCYGHLAVQLIRSGDTGRMVALNEGRYTSVPVDTMASGKKRVDV
ncbi:MAG: ATP-dependent 6-phosphofructokinase, partial [Dehalococcoidales bacterium]|nr:ATP-dependent 6-phosphofructokinase [Dehalococcoidales bacterium]